MKNKIFLCITIALLFFQSALANVYYVSTTGNDTYGDGSSGNPWKTLKHAVSKVPANQGHTIQIAAGTFIETGQIDIPLGVNLQGAGKSLTIIKAASSFYYNPASPGYATDKYLISLEAASPVNGNQTLKSFTIDGDSKQLHGGIYVRYRNHVIIEGVSVQNTNFNGIWLWDVKDSKITNTDLLNCSWGSTGYCVGALNLGNVERVEIDHLNVNESVGYGIKAIGPSGHNNIVELKIHDSRVSVHPYGLWNSGGAPNIAIELWSVNLVGSEIYNSYIDNTISLVNSNSPPSTGIQTIRVHHNILDMETRANGAGYGVELSIHDAEIDHNYFIKGRYGIAHWDNFVQNWNIHHNVFYALGGAYPGDMVRSQRSGLHNVNFYNNTIEFTGDRTMNVIGMYGGTSENVNVINNLFINNNHAYSYYPNSLIRLENGAVLNNLAVKNNLFDRLSIGSVAGTYSGNLTGDPKITKTGTRPNPYYMPAAGSPLIDAGLNILLGVLDPIVGSAPDIGAYEYTSTTVVSNQSPEINITSPADNSSFTAGSSITITANATDPDGSISKVEFYQGNTLLGTDTSSPYTFDWTNVGAGSYSLTAKATDNGGATVTSSVVSMTVIAAPLPSPWQNSDIGAVSAAGSASYSNPTFTVWGSGADIWDTADEFQFVYQTLSGDGVIVAKVNSLTNTNGWAKAGVMIRESLNANSTHATSVVTPSNGVSFQSRTVTGDISSHTTFGGHSAPVWVKIERSANTFTSSYSTDGSVWTVIGTGVITMTSNVYVGLCVTSHADGVLSAASFSDVSVTAGNTAPTVDITSPTNDTSFASGTSVTITANASDSDGTIRKVEFFSGTMKLGEDLTTPYSFSWSNAPVGTHSLTAKATDDQEATSSCGAVSIVVTDQNQPPTVSVTSPVNNATFTTGSTVTISANASDIDGAVSKVEFFFNGTTKLGEDLTSPYTIDWASVPAGSYSLTARATDMEGATNVSSSLTITISDADAFIKLGLYAPDATLSGNMKLSSDPTTSKGSYFSMPLGYGKNYYIPPPSSAQFNFQLEKSDNYVVWVRVKSPTINNQGFHLYDGKGTWTTWLAGIYTEWTWVQVTDAYTKAVAIFPYSAGSNVLRMAWFHDNVMVDRVLITNDHLYKPLEKSEATTARISSPSTGLMDEEEPNKEIAVFPNPVKEQLMITYTSATAQNVQITIKSATSLTGKQMIVPLHMGLNRIKVDMVNAQKGLYLVSIITSDGKRSLTKVLVTE